MYLNRLNNNIYQDSKHVIIAIPGFISEEEEIQASWSFFTLDADEYGISLFALKWQSMKKSVFI